MMKKLNLLHFRTQKHTEHSIFFHFQRFIVFAKPNISAIFIKQ